MTRSRFDFVDYSPAHAADWRIDSDTRISGGAITLSPRYEDDGIVFVSSNIGHNVHRLTAGDDEWLDLGFIAAPRQLEVCHLNGYGEFCATPVAVSLTFASDGTAFASAWKIEANDQGSWGLLKSIDKGVKWELVDFPSDDDVVVIAMSPRYSSDETVFAATGKALFISEDGGKTWREV